jgi:hypothetical protein
MAAPDGWNGMQERDGFAKHEWKRTVLKVSASTNPHLREWGWRIRIVCIYSQSAHRRFRSQRINNAETSLPFRPFSVLNAHITAHRRFRSQPMETPNTSSHVEAWRFCPHPIESAAESGIVRLGGVVVNESNPWPSSECGLLHAARIAG